MSINENKNNPRRLTCSWLDAATKDWQILRRLLCARSAPEPLHLALELLHHPLKLLHLLSQDGFLLLQPVPLSSDLGVGCPKSHLGFSTWSFASSQTGYQRLQQPQARLQGFHLSAGSCRGAACFCRAVHREGVLTAPVAVVPSREAGSALSLSVHKKDGNPGYSQDPHHEADWSTRCFDSSLPWLCVDALLLCSVDS